MGLARTLWLRGMLEQARRLAYQAIEIVEKGKQPVSICICVAFENITDLPTSKLNTRFRFPSPAPMFFKRHYWSTFVNPSQELTPVAL
jgi:hypothetical protein